MKMLERYRVEMFGAMHGGKSAEIKVRQVDEYVMVDFEGDLKLMITINGQSYKPPQEGE